MTNYEMVCLTKEAKKRIDDYPFEADDRFIMLGEISQMTGHCVIIRFGDNKTFLWYHTENFESVHPDDT